MGRRQTTAGADDHFKDSKEHEHDKNGELQIVVVSSCKYCGTGWRRLSGPRKVAHLCGIPGENIVHCEQRQDIPAKVVEDLLWTTKKGRLELEARELAKKKIAGQQVHLHCSKYTCTVRAGEVNPATKVVMNLPRYEEKYEDANVGDRQDDSDDEFIRRDRRSLTEVLAECKDDLIMDTEKQRLIKLVEEVLREAFLMMKAADGDKLIAGKVWRVCTDCAALH